MTKTTLYPSLVNPPQPQVNDFNAGIFTPWSVPSRAKIAAGIAIALITSGAFAPVPVPAQIIPKEPSWHQGWSEPVRVKKFITALQDVGTPDVVLPPRVLASQWFAPWSEPVRLKQGLRAYLQDTAADIPRVTPENITVDKWFSPLSMRPPAAFTVSTATFGFISVDNGLTNFWYQPWPDFAPGKRFLAANQQVLAWSTFTPAATPAVTDVRWFSPWSEPTRKKPPVQVGIDPPPSFPVIPNPGTATNLTFSDSPVAVVYNTQFQYQAFTYPVRFTPATITVDRWVYPWSEPVRFRRFGPQLQDTGAPDVPLPPVVRVSQWHEPWVDPVRVRRFNTALQPFTSLPVPPQPNFVRTINWYQPWSYPVWKKRGLRTDQQLTFTFGTPVIKTQVSVTMAAIEINLDRFLAGVFVGSEPPIPPAVAGANVSIEEIPVISGAAASIEET